MPRDDWAQTPDEAFEADVRSKRPRCALFRAAEPWDGAEFAVVVSDAESDWLHEVLGCGPTALDAWADAWEFWA